MRKPLFCSSIKVEDMTSSNQSFDVVGESRAERVRKILTSPLTKKKASNPDRIFGIPLEELVRRAPQGGQEVPLVVSRICEYIEHHGFHHEGLFRVSASARVVDKLRALFDRNGDANLEDVGDVMAAAGLLKQFLRALPEAVIPSHFLCQFVSVQEEHRQDNEECIRQLKKLVEQLPEENFNLLKYLMGFLVKVTVSEEYNRMNATALGIIFGPNIFRVSEGEDCLKEQSITNQVVTKFIKHYSAIFEADTNAPQPKRTPCAIRKQNALVATRPSPPKALSGQNQIEMDVDFNGGPKGVRSKASVLHEQFLSNTESSSKGTKMANGTCSNDLPLPAKLASKLSALENQENEFVELPVCNKCGNGEFDFTDLYDPPRPPPRIKHKKMDLSPDGAALSKLARSNSEEAPKMEAPVAPHMLTVRKCSSQENVLGAEGLMDSSPSPVTASLEEQFDNIAPAKKETVPIGFSCRQDHPLTPLNIDTSLQATPDLRMKDWSRHYDSETDVSEARRSAERLQYRSTSSKSRRMSSLKSSRRCVSMEVMRNAVGDQSHKENEIQASSKGSRKHHQKRVCPTVLAENPSEAPEDDPMQDVSAAAKPRLWLLDLHAAASANQEKGVEDGASPSTGSKPYVPSLDFSILHEHGDGSDPIPTNQLRASWPFSRRHHQDGDDDVMLSPRTCSLEKKAGYDSFLMDHNVPPSPPLEQEVGRKSSSMKDDGYGDPSFKVLNKRISALKRKIKKFEDVFEDESGYRPSHSEKMCRSDIKKYMSDLVKARKELKQLKEEMRMAAIANSCLLTSQGAGEMKSLHRSSGSQRLSTIPFPTIEESLDEMMKTLQEKRHSASRPEGLEEMNREQILEEKLAIQKSLLHFENLHGHPSTKVEKELMKPIYERYRNVKRLAAKASSPKMKESGMELQPILEHQTMDFTQASPKHSCLTAETSNEHEAEDKEDAVTATPVSSLDDPEMDNLMSPTHKKPEKKLADSCSLHELSHDELIEQEWKVRCEKKRLRRILKEFEEEFQRQNGRKAQREDRSPMDAVYLEYKQVKAKLKLLEALLTKHEHHYTI